MSSRQLWIFDPYEGVHWGGVSWVPNLKRKTPYVASVSLTWSELVFPCQLARPEKRYFRGGRDASSAQSVVERARRMTDAMQARIGQGIKSWRGATDRNWTGSVETGVRSGMSCCKAWDYTFVSGQSGPNGNGAGGRLGKKGDLLSVRNIWEERLPPSNGVWRGRD